MSDVEEYDDDEVEEDEVPTVPAGYIPGNATNAGGQAVVDGEVLTFDAEGNEVGRGQSTADADEEPA